MYISHECPRCLLEESRLFNNFEYALVHLFSEDSEYLEFYKESLRMGRTVYLDNSIFEKEEMFDHDEFAYWVNELGSINPDNFYYIVPDELEECKNTIDSFKKWCLKYNNLPGKKIGVVQGKNLEELLECYFFMADCADRVAISFDYSYYNKQFPNAKNKWEGWMLGRQEFIQYLVDNELDYVDVHLLGCGLPQEFKYYKDMSFIVSCDTSNPIVMGMLGHRYTENGLDFKESIKLVDLFEAELDNNQLDNIKHNIEVFKSFAR